MSRPPRPKLNHFWKTPELKLLDQEYAGAKPEDLKRLFPNHSLTAIYMMANRRGLRKYRNNSTWQAVAAAHVPTFQFGG